MKPIANTSKEDPLGFGLGVGQATKPNIGTFWYYQGTTLGYRVVYFYLPKTRSVATVGLNSQPDSNESKVGDLMDQVFEVLQDAGKIYRLYSYSRYLRRIDSKSATPAAH